MLVGPGRPLDLTADATGLLPGLWHELARGGALTLASWSPIGVGTAHAACAAKSVIRPLGIACKAGSCIATASHELPPFRACPWGTVGLLKPFGHFTSWSPGHGPRPSARMRVRRRLDHFPRSFRLLHFGADVGGPRAGEGARTLVPHKAMTVTGECVDPARVKTRSGLAQNVAPSTRRGGAANPLRTGVPVHT